MATLTIPHTVDGFRHFEATCQKLGLPPEACLVGMETAHNLFIDFLWSRAYGEVYIIPPSVVKSSRGRYGPSGAHTDQSDAFLIADLLRMTWHVFIPGVLVHCSHARFVPKSA